MIFVVYYIVLCVCVCVLAVHTHVCLTIRLFVRLYRKNQRTDRNYRSISTIIRSVSTYISNKCMCVMCVQ